MVVVTALKKIMTKPNKAYPYRIQIREERYCKTKKGLVIT